MIECDVFVVCSALRNDYFLDQLEEFRRLLIRTKQVDFPPVLVARTMSDLSMQCPFSGLFRKYCRYCKIPYFSTSALEGWGVEEMFDCAIKMALVLKKGCLI